MQSNDMIWPFNLLTEINYIWLIVTSNISNSDSEAPNPKPTGGMATINGVYRFYTFDEVHDIINSLIANFTTPSIQFSTIFREVANGFFMAEGSITGSFRAPNSHWFSPQMSLSQNVSGESLSFFVILYFALQQTGVFKLSVTSAGNLHVTLVTYSWDNILSI
jgi:hypothetical protein